LLGILLLTFASSLKATDFFVTPKGDDSADGRTKVTSWRSIERLNRTRFQAGDRILFQGRKSFAGNLRLSAEDAGAPNAPVVVTSFGSGRATILAGRDTGITIESAGHILISNIVVRGLGATNNTGYGLLCDNRIEEFRRLEGLTIENVEISGFGIFGILISGQAAGFERVRISRCQLHHNLRGGMEIAGRLPYDSPLYAHADARVSDCDAYENSGDPEYSRNHSGSGMVLYQVDGGLMERCRAWKNGELCRSKTGGGVGLWTCASRRVVIQHCESFENKTSGKDGGGFDIDGGSVECVLQYNYSHDNDGPGLMVYTYAYASHSDRGNIVRFNISENDSRKSRSYAGLWIRSDGPGMTGVEIYNNTVRVGPWTDQAAYVRGDGVQARLYNNMFIASGRAIPLRVENPSPGLRFENNLYWTYSGTPVAEWGSNRFDTLEAWRLTTGQESNNGRALGLYADPQLARSPSPSVAVTGTKPAIMLRYRPLSKEAIKARGIPYLPPEDEAHKVTDLLGRALSESNWPIGAIGAASKKE
jgi:hypothetical protein